MQAIKAMVIFMAILLVGGIALLIFGVMNDWHKKGMDSTQLEEERSSLVENPQILSSEAVKIAPFGDWDVPLPSGAVIRDMEAKDGRLFLRYVSGGKGGVIVLDLSNKTHLGTIRFQ